ncbi:bacteriocin-like protein [Chryseobacterium sp. JUb7]|uniref:bacteriocin-like protein n=1 Tax=Chryseobacterium sp. JUb7 TaxID=2940599 RepID=UPI002167EBB1|nr:hypothetical protein [Chryseobacterium sp. JUb7]MCS3530820.1 hypothetical protein [Chryseobacterium sp. JUb7]
MKNLKKLSRTELTSINGGNSEASRCCGSWCNGLWQSCYMEHLACPPDGETSPPPGWDGGCPF